MHSKILEKFKFNEVYVIVSTCLLHEICKSVFITLHLLSSFRKCLRLIDSTELRKEVGSWIKVSFQMGELNSLRRKIRSNIQKPFVVGNYVTWQVWHCIFMT
jgi:hypothetical protein